MDSIPIYNAIFAAFFSDSSFHCLKDSGLMEIADVTGIEIVRSADKRLSVVTWDLENPSPTPAYCSDVIVTSGGLTKTISLYGGGVDDFGDDIHVDSIIDFHLKGTNYYILIGSNKCGSFCEDNVAAVYTVANGEILKCADAFFNGKEYLDEVDFQYTISDRLRTTSGFYLERGKLVAPVFDQEDMRQVGTRKYEILRPRI